MNLKHLTDRALLADTRNLVTKEREYLTKILHHLKEIDRRKLYCDLGYSSLYDFCIRYLGYSEGNAHRRMQACRLLADIPELDKKIESGALTLSNISQANSFFKQNSIEDASDKKIVLEQMEHLSRSEGEKMLFALSGENKGDKEIIRRSSGETTRISVVLDDRTIEKCKKLMGLLGKVWGYKELIDYMVDTSIRELEHKKFKVLRKIKVSPPHVEVKKVVSNSVKRDVYLRDKKCVKCGSTSHLNFDHRKPLALGGKSDAQNIRLLCFNCNQRARIQAKL